MFFLGSPEWHSVQYQDTTPRFNSNLWNYKNRSKLFRNLLSAQSEPKFVYWFLDWFYGQSHKTDRCLQIFKCRHIQIVSGIPFLHVYILNFENFRYIWDLKRNLNLFLKDYEEKNTKLLLIILIPFFPKDYLPSDPT